MSTQRVMNVAHVYLERVMILYLTRSVMLN